MDKIYIINGKSDLNGFILDYPELEFDDIKLLEETLKRHRVFKIYVDPLEFNILESFKHFTMILTIPRITSYNKLGNENIVI